MKAIVFAISILFALITAFRWAKHGKDGIVIETVEIDPPERLNSAKHGYLCKESSETKDVASLLIYLARDDTPKSSSLKTIRF